MTLTLDINFKASFLRMSDEEQYNICLTQLKNAQYNAMLAGFNPSYEISKEDIFDFLNLKLKSYN